MVSFAEISDMQARFEERELLQLTDDALSGALDPLRIDQAIASASAIVEGYVAARYQVETLRPVPLMLVDATCDIARFRLYRTSPPEDVDKRNNQAIALLQGIRSGRVKLDAGIETNAARDGVILSETGDRTMSRRQLRGF